MTTPLIEQAIFRGVAQARVRHVRPVPMREAHGLVAEVYQQMERDFQLVPPVTVHSPAPELLAAVWAVTRESLVAGNVSKTNREAVATAVSKVNECPFCVDVHTTMLSGGARRDVIRGILSGDLETIRDHKTRAIVEWTLATRTPDAPILRNPPFTPGEAPEIIGTAVLFHYINRIVNVFMYDGSPLRLPAGLGWLRGAFRRLAGGVIAGRVMRLQVHPGESLSLLPETSTPPVLPDAFAWAKPKPAVAEAFARFAAACEEAGQTALSGEVRELVMEKLRAWRGEDPGMSRRWVEDAVAGLATPDQTAGRLALLTAFASYQVDEEVVHQFRQDFPSDPQLVAATAWAGYAAAQRLATWLRGDSASSEARCADSAKLAGTPATRAS